MHASRDVGGAAAGGAAPGGVAAVLVEAPVAPYRRAPWVERVPGPTWAPRWDRRIVAALVALAAMLRIPNLGRAYWVDEGISVGIAGHPLAQIPGLLRHDGSPPLFYVILHGWLRWFGSSPVATHSLALATSLAVVVAAAWAGRILFGRAAGLAAAALAGTSPFLNWYGTETRMYTLVCALSLVAVTFAVRAVRHRRGADAVGAVLAGAALLYTHNWGLYLVAATVGVVAVRAWRDGDRRLGRSAVAAGAAVGVLYLPWVPSFAAQATSTAAPWAVPPGVGDIFADPASMMGGTVGVLVAPLLVLGSWWTLSERRAARLLSTDEDRAGSDGAGLLAVVGVATLAIGWLVAQVEPSWTVRYLAVTFGPLLLAAAGSLAGTSRGRAVLLGVCALCSGWSLIGTVLPNTSAGSAKSNVAAVATAASAYLHPGDVVVVTQTEQMAVLRHYLPAGLTWVTPTGPVADPTVVDWRNLVPRLQGAEVCATVLPSVAALPPGANVLEIAPLRAIGASGSTWSRTVNGRVVDIEALLAHQSALEATRSFAEATVPKPFSAVVGELFVKQPGAITCP